MNVRRRSHVFLVGAGGAILVLQQAAGARWWEQPGGDLELGESADQAVVRETFEETGLRIEVPELLREWSYRNRGGEGVGCYAFVAAAPGGDVVLSDEHTAHQWISVDAYIEQYCSEQVAAVAPEWARLFLAEMRENCRLLREWLGRAADG